MNYIDEINEMLKPQEDNSSNQIVIDLFAGCGGLSLGFEAHGFKTIGYEKDKNACNTYNLNLNGFCHNEELTVNTDYRIDSDILIGGPPCQPFSAFGRKLGLKDSRDGFPIFISAVEKIKPKIFLFENVRGLLFERNRWYLEQVLEKLEKLNYKVDYKLLNAKHFGVPQSRERLFVVGYKEGMFEFPSKNNKIITSGEALGELAHKIPSDSKFLTESMDDYISKYEKASYCIRPRDLNLDKPARTLTCRNIAAATSDMHRIKLPDGRRRRLLHIETARLQSFPDWFRFEGDKNSIFYQIGNAVPPMLAYYIAQSVKEYLSTSSLKNDVKILNRITRINQLELFGLSGKNIPTNLNLRGVKT